MSKREKTLLLIIGSVGALLVGKWGYEKYTHMLEAADAKEVNLTTELSKAHLERAEADKARERWLALGAQTISVDEDEASRRLRQELGDIVKESGLENEDITVAPQLTALKKSARMLSGTVTAEGDLGRIVEFLYQTSRQPYMLRVRILQLSQVGARAPVGRLKMLAKVETPILLPTLLVPRITPAVLDREKRKPVERTLLARSEDYRSIAAKKIFEPYVPPVPVPTKVASPKPGHNTDAQANTSLVWMPSQHATSYKVYFGATLPDKPIATQPSTTFQPTGLVVGTKYFWRVDAVNVSGETAGDVWNFTVAPPPIVKVQDQQPVIVQPPTPADGNMVLSRVLSSPRSQQAVLVDPAQQNVPTAQDRRVEVGEQMFGGTLILVHPRGAVTELNGARRFHPIGVALSACQPLSDQTQPEVNQDLMKLEARAKGISQMPG